MSSSSVSAIANARGLRRWRVLAWLSGVLVAACASPRAVFVPLDADHPASPQAAEAPIADPGASLVVRDVPPSAEASEVPMHGHAAGDHGATERPEQAGSESPGPTHVCPMHPEVTSEGPATCPVCGMKLVPLFPEKRDGGESR